MLGNVGQCFLRDPKDHFRSCIVRFYPGRLFSMKTNGDARFALPLSGQFS